MSTIVEPKEQTETALSAIVEHWAKARIETPLHVASRLEESAKILLAVAGVLQGILIAVVKLESPVPAPVSPYAIPALAMLVATAVFAALVLVVQSRQLATKPVYDLFRTSATDAQTMTDLDKAVKAWCESIDRILLGKRILLGIAMLSLVGSMVLSLECVRFSINHQSSTTTAVQDAPAQPAAR
ncbi:MAG TPA: hypothetical protein VFS20_29720 [Longimicrobium sp.]|nr:hypothetical protein [Longimicrobium sp.]